MGVAPLIRATGRCLFIWPFLVFLSIGQLYGQTSVTPRIDNQPLSEPPQSRSPSARAQSTSGVTSAFPPDFDRFRVSRQFDQLLSSTVAGDHEDAGVITHGESEATNKSSTTYIGVYANHLVYKNGAVSLRLPPEATHDQTLFAATTRPPNGSCIEVGTAYTTSVTTHKTAAALYAFDFCLS